MSESIALMSDSSSQSPDKPIILDSLPDVSLGSPYCSTRMQQQIDLMLLALEALAVGGSEHMLAIAQQLELQDIIENRVVFWRLRCSNPWRRSYTRENLTLDRGKALVLLIGYRAKQLTVIIRQLLAAEQEVRQRNLPLQTHFQLFEYLEQFQVHFRSRMNRRRTKVGVYLASEDELDELAIALLNKLLFCTGTKGLQRFWVSLFDGEVA